MRRSAALALVLVLAALTGCPMPPSRAAVMQQTASDFNTDVRFGRTEIAMERVMPGERPAFSKRRKGWGHDVTIADYELVGAKLIDDDHADVSIKYDWYHSDEGDLRSTTVKQKWEAQKGAWLLAGEKCVDGDEGLFGGGPARAKTEGLQPLRSVQFPTVRFGD